jgi:hypothetical protein
MTMSVIRGPELFKQNVVLWDVLCKAHMELWERLSPGHSSILIDRCDTCFPALIALTELGWILPGFNPLDKPIPPPPPAKRPLPVDEVIRGGWPWPSRRRIFTTLPVVPQPNGGRINPWLALISFVIFTILFNVALALFR